MDLHIRTTVRITLLILYNLKSKTDPHGNKTQNSWEKNIVYCNIMHETENEAINLIVLNYGQANESFKMPDGNQYR